MYLSEKAQLQIHCLTQCVCVISDLFLHRSETYYRQIQNRQNSLGTGAVETYKEHPAFDPQRFGLDIAEFPDYSGLSCQCRGSLPFPVVINFHTPSEVVDKLNNMIITEERIKWHRFEREAFTKADGYRCPSEALAQVISRDFEIPSNQIRIIRNPVSTEIFDRIEKSHRTDRFDFLFAGRLEFRKGAELLLRSLNKILRIDNRINVTFAGKQSLVMRTVTDRPLRELSGIQSARGCGFWDHSQ